MIATQQTYRRCTRCKGVKPLDTVHFRPFTAPHKFASICRGCEIVTGQQEAAPPIAPVIPREVQPMTLPMGGTMHAYASKETGQQKGNPLGKNQHTEESQRYPFQVRTWHLWRIAVEAVTARYGLDTEAYHRECDGLWDAFPHGDDWCDEMCHATFAVYAKKVIGGGQ